MTLIRIKMDAIFRIRWQHTIARGYALSPRKYGMLILVFKCSVMKALVVSVTFHSPTSSHHLSPFQTTSSSWCLYSKIYLINIRKKQIGIECAVSSTYCSGTNTKRNYLKHHSFKTVESKKIFGAPQFNCTRLRSHHQELQACTKYGLRY